MLLLVIIYLSCANTFTKWLALVISLGYGSILGALGVYSSRIFLLTFIYNVTEIVSYGCFYINQQQPLSQSIRIMMSLPQIVCNLIFIIWTLQAFLRTLIFMRLKNFEY